MLIEITQVNGFLHREVSNGIQLDRSRLRSNESKIDQSRGEIQGSEELKKPEMPATEDYRRSLSFLVTVW